MYFHGYVLDTLQEHQSRITLLPLPTYAPWTNPIEKVWRLFNQDLFHMHPWSQDWERLKQEVTRLPASCLQRLRGPAALRWLSLRD